MNYSKKCSSCNGTGYEDNQLNHEIFKPKIKNVEEKKKYIK